MTKKNIKHYRGDTFDATIVIDNYTPSENDVIKFGIKHTFDDEECVIEKEIDPKTMTIHIDSEETQELEESSFVYDIQITMTDTEGVEHTQTFLYGRFRLTKDVVR